MSFERLLRYAEDLTFEPHRIELNEEGRYDIRLDPDFPFVIKLFDFRAGRFTPGATWHERHELFLPLDGAVRMRIAERTVELAAGDLLVVDHLKLHHVVDFPGFRTRAVVISFLPELVAPLGLAGPDQALLLPFYYRPDGTPHVLAAGSLPHARAIDALTDVLECYFTVREEYRQEGCKAHFLVLLYHLVRGLGLTRARHAELLKEKNAFARFSGVFDHVAHHFAERITLADAARIAGMSQPQFLRRFKPVAGMTFGAYLTRVRLTHAHHLLRETDLSIAEIAHRVGFTDQSHFGRQFRKWLGVSPREARRAVR